MAAQYTEVSLEDMDKFLKRAFRTLRPVRNQQYNEYYYDLTLGTHVGIRVWSSVGVHSGQGAQVGADAIRVQLISLKDKRPLEKGKAPIVKRTQGWRNSLQDRIEDCIEKYESNDEFWEGWAETRQMNRPQRQDAPPPPVDIPKTKEDLRDEYERDNAESDDTRKEREEWERRQRNERVPTPTGPSPDQASPKQVGYALVLMRGMNNNKWHEMIEPKFRFGHPPSKEELEKMPKRQISLLIDVLKGQSGGGGGYRRYAAEAENEIGVGVYDYGR